MTSLANGIKQIKQRDWPKFKGLTVVMLMRNIRAWARGWGRHRPGPEAVHLFSGQWPAENLHFSEYSALPSSCPSPTLSCSWAAKSPGTEPSEFGSALGGGKPLSCWVQGPGNAGLSSPGFISLPDLRASWLPSPSFPTFPPPCVPFLLGISRPFLRKAACWLSPDSL